MSQEKETKEVALTLSNGDKVDLAVTDDLSDVEKLQEWLDNLMTKKTVTDGKKVYVVQHIVSAKYTGKKGKFFVESI